MSRDRARGAAHPSLPDVESGAAGTGGDEPEGLTACPGCAGRFAATDGPTHEYLTVSPACMGRFDDALALHYSDFRYWPAHQLLVDAYSLQHSASEDPRARRSAAVHLTALYAQLRLGQGESRVIAIRKLVADQAIELAPHPWPPPSCSIHNIELDDPGRHFRSVQQYAACVLADWRDHAAFAEALCDL